MILPGAKGKYEWNTSGHGWGKASECNQVRKVRAGLSAGISISGTSWEKAAEVLEK